jgi:hypothetical protein
VRVGVGEDEDEDENEGGCDYYVFAPPTPTLFFFHMGLGGLG